MVSCEIIVPLHVISLTCTEAICIDVQAKSLRDLTTASILKGLSIPPAFGRSNPLWIREWRAPSSFLVSSESEQQGIEGSSTLWKSQIASQDSWALKSVSTPRSPWHVGDRTASQFATSRSTVHSRGESRSALFETICIGIADAEDATAFREISKLHSRLHLRPTHRCSTMSFRKEACESIRRSWCEFCGLGG